MSIKKGHALFALRRFKLAQVGMARLERFGNQIFQSHCQDWKIWGSFFNEIMGDSLTVEQRTLTPLVEVRILVPQPTISDT